jgi:menaquinone-dependent protoporphyrinogen oxidase
MHAYVITAHKHGSTAEVGAAIADRLREHGHTATTLDAANVSGLDPDTAVVIGSPIYMGKWLKPARELLDALAAEASGRPVFVFTVGPVGDPPKPEGAAPEKEVQRFAADRALSQRVLTGKLDRSELSRLERLAVKAAKAPDGDYRDWAEIRAWADEISDALSAVCPPRAEAKEQAPRPATEVASS